jgi:hypothetical protein
MAISFVTVGGGAADHGEIVGQKPVSGLWGKP